MSTLSSAGETAPALHPLNHGFSWTPARGPFRLITDEQARSFNERGFFVLENAIDPRDRGARARRDRSVRGEGRGISAIASRGQDGYRAGGRNHFHHTSGEAFESIARVFGEPQSFRISATI